MAGGGAAFGDAVVGCFTPVSRPPASCCAAAAVRPASCFSGRPAVDATDPVSLRLVALSKPAWSFDDSERTSLAASLAPAEIFFAPSDTAPRPSLAPLERSG